MFRARRKCKILAGVLAEYVEDDFAPTTQLWTIAADRSRIRILQLARICNLKKQSPDDILLIIRWGCRKTAENRPLEPDTDNAGERKAVWKQHTTSPRRRGFFDG